MVMMSRLTVGRTVGSYIASSTMLYTRHALLIVNMCSLARVIEFKKKQRNPSLTLSFPPRTGYSSIRPTQAMFTLRRINTYTGEPQLQEQVFTRSRRSFSSCPHDIRNTRVS